MCVEIKKQLSLLQITNYQLLFFVSRSIELRSCQDITPQRLCFNDVVVAKCEKANSNWNVKLSQINFAFIAFSVISFTQKFLRAKTVFHAKVAGNFCMKCENQLSTL